MTKESKKKNLNFPTAFGPYIIISNVFKRRITLILENPQNLKTDVLLADQIPNNYRPSLYQKRLSKSARESNMVCFSLLSKA